MLPEQSSELQVPEEVPAVEGSVPADDQSSARKPAETLVTEAELERALEVDPLIKKYQEILKETNEERVRVGNEIGRIHGSLNYYRSLRRKAFNRIKLHETKIKERRIRLHRGLLHTKMIQLNRISPRALGMSS